VSIRVPYQTLFSWLHEQDVRYVVLRDIDKLDNMQQLKDLDLLIEDQALPAMFEQFGRSKSGLKVDVYGVNGEHGTDYHGHAHLPAEFGTEILLARERQQDIYVPTPADERDALLYHIAYHKCLQSGVHHDDASLTADNPAVTRIKTLMHETSSTLELTLGAIDEHLNRRGLGISESRLVAYLQHDFRYGRKSYFHALIQNRHPGELNLFVIRAVAVRQGKADALLDKLASHYTIMSHKPIPLLTRWRTRKHMRGGKWKRGGLPHVVVVVFDPHPVVPSAQEREIHPFVLNRNQFVKVEWRDWFTRITGVRDKDNPIHSTDNEAEALGHLPLFFDAEEIDTLRSQLADLRRQCGGRASCAD